MSSSTSEAAVQTGRLVVHIAENGHSFKLACDEYTLVEAVQKFVESSTGIRLVDQLLLCEDLKLEPNRPLSAYKLPSDEREVFLFNKSRMRSNSPNPVPEQVEVIDIPNPPLPSSSHDPHRLDDAPDPALKALPSYERQFRYHFQLGNAIYRRTLAKFETCERLLREQKLQERALEIARGNVDHFYKMINLNYEDFLKCYSRQHGSHAKLLINFGRNKEKLRSVKILPSLQTDNHKCLMDFVKEESLQKTWQDCSISHQQFENKVSEFKVDFGDLKTNADHLFSGKASYLVKEVELSVKYHQPFINELKSIMQALSKDVNTVKKLVDDSLSCQLSSSLRPHDAISALGPMYESHDKTHLPKMHASDRAVSNLLKFCTEKKNEMNIFVHNYMQKIAYIQYTIKDVRYKFTLFQETLKRQNDQFQPLKVLHGIFPAYRACLAEVVRRKAAMKIYMGKAGLLAEKLASERESEVRRREEFIKAHSIYIPRDILSSMGMYDNPNPCEVNVTPFDTNLIDIDFSDLERYAPESLLRFSLKNDDGSREELFEDLDLVEVAGTSKMEVENAKLKAELASKIALISSMSAEFDYESPEDSKSDSSLKHAAEKTSEALLMKEEYEKHLKSLLKAKQMQCESYEKRIQELEQRLSDQYNNSKSEVLGGGESHMQHVMGEAACASSSLKSGVHNHDNMTDSSVMINTQLDSSMLDLHGDKAQICEKDKKETSNMAVSLSQPGLDAKASDSVLLGLNNELAEKSSALDDSKTRIQSLIDEVSKLGRELEINKKLLDESQMNFAHLENCLHEAREEAQMHLCAADRKASQYTALRSSAVKMHALFERLKSCVSSAGVAAFVESLRDLAQSLASSANESGDSSTADFRECVRILYDKVSLLSSQRTELLDRYSKAEAANKQLTKDLDEKTELVTNLFMKHQLEKQANKEKISFIRLEVQEIAAFVLNSSGHYEAINRACPHYYLSSESVALFSDHLPNHPTYIIGQVVHIERKTVKSPLSTSAAEDPSDRVDILTSNPYGLPVGCEYFTVTIAMLPDHNTSPS